ncbi:MAG: TatD family hydrolase [Candidatus Omnitrophica bacterium]|nr:TatD family hydrolase [Candidatus Omnitrophota bacterium]
MLIDTHCHLDFPEFDLDRTEVIKRALGSDVRYIINVGSSLEGTKRSIELANKYEPIYTSVGIHPHDTHQLDTQVFEDLRGLAKFKKVVAIGEVGLDYYRPFPPKEVQIDAFLKFIRLSLDFSLPLIVHIRSAHKDALQIFKQEMKSICGVLHCFSGDEDFLKSCLELGLHISFTCNITFKKADDLRRLVKLVPLDRLLLETDGSNGVRMYNIQTFLKTERIYILMAIFILLFNLFSHLKFLADSDLDKSVWLKEDISTPDIRDALKEENLKKAIEERKGLAALFVIISLSMILTLFFGILLTIKFLIMKIKAKPPALLLSFITRRQKTRVPTWNIADIFRVAVTVIFFAYLFHILEAIAVIAFKIRWADRYIVAVLNTFLLDMLVLSLITYLIKVKYNHSLKELGLRLHNFLKSIFLGLVGYVTLLPTLVFILFVILWMANFFNYQPPPQPIFDFLFYEKREWFLLLSIIFVVLIAPIVEEILFRGFVYTAIKNKFGRRTAYLLSTILFAGLHANLVGFLPIAVLGILLAYLYEHTGSLIPSITVHVTHNSLIALFVFLVRGIM